MPCCRNRILGANDRPQSARRIERGGRGRPRGGAGVSRRRSPAQSLSRAVAGVDDGQRAARRGLGWRAGWGGAGFYLRHDLPAPPMDARPAGKCAEKRKVSGCNEKSCRFVSQLNRFGVHALACCGGMAPNGWTPNGGALPVRRKFIRVHPRMAAWPDVKWLNPSRGTATTRLYACAIVELRCGLDGRSCKLVIIGVVSYLITLFAVVVLTVSGFISGFVIVLISAGFIPELVVVFAIVFVIIC